MASGVADALLALSRVFIFAVIVLAVVDFRVLGMRTIGAAPGGGGGLDRRGPMLRAIAPFIILWAGVQVLSLVAFLVLGDTGRGVTSTVLHLFYGLGFAFLGAAGWFWCVRCGMPALPFVWLARRRARRAPSPFIGGRILARRPALWFAALLAAPVGVTAAIVVIGAAGVHPRLTQRLDLQSHGTAANVLFMVHLLVSAAVAEEVLFRHYALPRIAATLRHWGKRAGGMLAPLSGRGAAAAAAIAVTAFFFACGHAGMLESFAPKFVQILVLGVSLGTAQVLIGTEAAIAMHILFNLAAAMIGVLVK
jgi:membrane protease YdiL (CAAX protease family)